MLATIITRAKSNLHHFLEKIILSSLLLSGIKIYVYEYTLFM